MRDMSKLRDLYAEIEKLFDSKQGYTILVQWEQRVEEVNDLICLQVMSMISPSFRDLLKSCYLTLDLHKS